MSLSLTFSSISSDSDYEDDYPIRKSYKDEPFYYDGISDEELHSHLNREFEERVNWIKYGVCFSSENRLHDDGGDYIIYEPYNGCDIVDTNIHGDFSGKGEGVYEFGYEDFVEKEYIKTKPKSVFDSMIKNFKKVTSLDKKCKLLHTVNQHKFSCILHDKPYSSLQ